MKEAARLIKLGYSVLPLQLPDKRPIGEWKKYQSEIITTDEFHKRLLTHPGDIGIGIVTGNVSGRLEAIDIDDKHYPGIGARFLKELKDFYPDVFSKLRVEKTLNNGYHILYRISDGISKPKSSTLASRPATDEEKQTRPDLKKYGFIELKAEGGKITIPPTPGYSIIQNTEIPTITRHDADCIIALARSYDEMPVQVEQPYRKSTAFRNYSVNPWEDYNLSPDAEKILENHGWKFIRETNTHIYFERPGEKSKGTVGGSFVREKRIYYIFTTTTEFESEKGYSPSSILCQLEFNGDTKECFKYLVEKGFGAFTEVAEKKIIRKSIVENKPLPLNISKKGKDTFEKEKKVFESKYPHGIFWEGDLEDGYRINRERILRVCEDLGFRNHTGSVVKIDDKEIFEYGKEFVDELKSYIKEDNELVQVAICDKYEDYIQKSLKYLVSRLPELDTSLLLTDTRHVAYKPFANGIIKVTRAGISLIPYEQNEKLYFERDVINDSFDLTAGEGGLFADFIDKAILDKTHLREYLGFLLHRYKDTSTSYFVLMLEAVDDPKKGGGAGKNILSNLLGRFTTNVEVPGTQVKYTSEFFQAWNGERIMTVSDLPKDFDFLFLKNLTSNSAILKRLYKDEIKVDASELPKLLLSSNYSVDISDGGLARRVMILEFTDFFTRAGGVDVHYEGKLFPDDWSDEDWQGYYHFMVNSLHSYISSPKLQKTAMSESGWVKSYHITHGYNTFEFIESNIEEWKRRVNVPANEFSNQYDLFCATNGIFGRFKKSSRKINDALSEYCEHFGIDFVPSKVVRTSTGVFSCKVFGPQKSPETGKDELPF